MGKRAAPVIPDGYGRLDVLDGEASPSQAPLVDGRELHKYDVGPPLGFELALDEDWVVAYLVTPESGKAPVVAEIRIFPKRGEHFLYMDADGATFHRERPVGRWEVDLPGSPYLPLGEPLPVPSGGLNARLLNKVRLPATLIRDAAETIRSIDPDSTESRGLQPNALPPSYTDISLSWAVPRIQVSGRRPGKGGRSPIFYATLSLMYVQLLAEGSRRPIPDLTKRLQKRGHFFSVGTVRKMVWRCGEKGYLQGRVARRAGGELTDLSRQILSDERNQQARKESE